MIYKIINDVYLDKIEGCYKNIIVISPPPDPVKDPYLKQITKIIHKEKLSPYKDTSPCCAEDYCINAFINPYTISCNCELLCSNKIELLFNVLIENGYEIDTKLTEIMHLSKMKTNGLICYIKK